MTQSKIVIDANIVLEWINPDETAQKKNALYIYELLKKGEIVVYSPAFLLVEVINILFWKKKLAVEDILAFISRVKNSGVNFVLDKEQTENIIKLMDKYQITSYDAQYLQLALEMKCKLATFDEKLKQIEDVRFDFSKLTSQLS